VEHSWEFCINYDFNYKKELVWDNKFILYGLSKIKATTEQLKQMIVRVDFFGVKAATGTILVFFHFKARWTAKITKISIFLRPFQLGQVCYGKK
jgi:hypothetical protein